MVIHGTMNVCETMNLNFFLKVSTDTFHHQNLTEELFSLFFSLSLKFRIAKYMVAIYGLDMGAKIY